ncbi:hypothetical protein [Crocosphaera sp. XPORK-15E]|uniref:hypothetical protein n=1 Tax=Crocosphaera sp. XPORK-15E TaxID=3110247 RepID=UPI002B1F56A4|nr:hypothetical protein [Crocosphaera sp. XPORK-15E]MEA5536127.1 hypothetical protein [Crocosphaera sp. XPORK-15E]
MTEFDCLRPISYETRNLGLPSFEINKTFLENPDEQALRIALEDKNNTLGQFFIQARIPKQNIKIVHLLEKIGFYYVETTIEPQINFKRNNIFQDFLNDKTIFLPQKYSLEKFKTIQENKDNISQYNKIKSIAEESFSEDRFHIDFNCSEDIANLRFSYWVDDLYNDNDVIFYSLEYLGKTIAFLCHKNQNLILAGFSKQYVNSGLGAFFWLSVLEQMLIQGISQAKTLISINNVSVLNLYSRIGFRFKNVSVTLHYWKTQNNQKFL